MSRKTLTQMLRLTGLKTQNIDRGIEIILRVQHNIPSAIEQEVLYTGSNALNLQLSYSYSCHK